MAQTSMLGLLKADESQVRNGLRASKNIDKSTETCAKLLNNELGSMLRRYNAAYENDKMRQALAECVTATAREELELLLAGEIKKENSRRQRTANGIFDLAFAFVLCVAAMLLITRIPLASYFCLALAVLCAYIAGLVWYKGQPVSASVTLDPELAWNALRKTAETMDRKIEEFSAQDWTPDHQETLHAEGEEASLDPETLALFSDLMEARYMGNGDFALRQLAKLRPYLIKHGITPVEYSVGKEDLFDLLPSKNRTTTQRPAMMSGNELLMKGKATIREN